MKHVTPSAGVISRSSGHCLTRNGRCFRIENIPPWTCPISSPSPYQQLRDELIAEPKTWLVTGVGGFIGSSLLQELLRLGQVVIGLDNFSTGYESNLDEVRTEDGPGTFHFIEGDIRDRHACRAACEGVDFVLHQAALASVPRSIDDPLTNTQVNVEGFLNVLLAAREANVQRVVYASSSAVYGDSTDVPQLEDRTGHVLSPYAAAKKTDELYAGVFQRTYGLQAVGLRYFNVFGRRQDPNGAYAAVIPRWVSNLLNGERCTVYGDGDTTRDFVYVADAVQANLLAATTHSGMPGEVYNVGRGQETSLNELFRMIRLGLTGYEPEVASQEPVHEEFRVGDIRRSVANISKARRRLGYEPSVTVAEGLGEALEWYATRALESANAIDPAVIPNF
jgi:UDP-N-acetylglucosamine 4-epimerase